MITTSRFQEPHWINRDSIDDGHFLIDTPGIIHRHQMAHYLGKEI